MGNSFTARDSSGPDRLHLTNGGTDAFFDVLTLAGAVLARTPWQQNLVLHFADGHRHSRGFAGFDLGDVPWTADWAAEKDFFLQVVDLAATGHGWERLRYRAPYTGAHLAAYRDMLAGYPPVPRQSPQWGDWRRTPAPESLTRCRAHDIYQGAFGCRLCDPEIQPSG